MEKEMNVPDKLRVLLMWLLKIIGLFVPALREMPEMMYQYDRDYVFNSGKFNNKFSFRPTSYEEGVKATIKK